MNPNSTHQTAIARNVAMFADLLASLGAPSLSLTYSGGGDEGQVENCQIDWPEGKEQAAPAEVSFVRVTSTYVNTALTHEAAVTAMRFDDACDALLELVLEQHGHMGWENGVGGGGTLTLTVEGALTVEHYDIVEQHEEDLIVYAAPPQAASACAAVPGHRAS